MSKLKKLAYVLVGLGVLFVAVGFLLPRSVHVERSVVIQSPPGTVFTVLNGFHLFNQWSPWADLDPATRTSFEGPATGVGAKMSWSGSAEVGEGSQEILESVPPERIRVKLTFGDFPGEFAAAYLLAPVEGGTRLTWTFDADYGGSLMGRYFGLLSERMVGPDYEKGLARLKAFVERLPARDFSALNLSTTQTETQPIAYLSIRAGNTVNQIGVALGVAYSRLSGFLQIAGVAPSGRPIAIFRGKGQDTLDFDAALPIAGTDLQPSGAVKIGTLPAVRAIKAEYRGSYAGLGLAHEQIRAYLGAAGLEPAGDPWEQFVSDPAKTPEADLVTHIFYPVK